MLKTWISRLKGGAMLPDLLSLNDTISDIANVVETRNSEKMGLTNFVVGMRAPSDAQSNFSFFRSDAAGTHFWKCILRHGWTEVDANQGDRANLQKLAETHVVKSFTAPKSGIINSRFGADPVGHRISFDGGEVDYTWVFELEPYHWPEQIRAIFGAWENKIPALDTEIQRIWVR